jgi:hypothetical protein
MESREVSSEYGVYVRLSPPRSDASCDILCSSPRTVERALAGIPLAPALHPPDIFKNRAARHTPEVVEPSREGSGEGGRQSPSVPYVG